MGWDIKHAATELCEHQCDVLHGSTTFSYLQNTCCVLLCIVEQQNLIYMLCS